MLGILGNHNDTNNINEWQRTNVWKVENTNPDFIIVVICIASGCITSRSYSSTSSSSRGRTGVVSMIGDVDVVVFGVSSIGVVGLVVVEKYNGDLLNHNGLPVVFMKRLHVVLAVHWGCRRRGGTVDVLGQRRSWRARYLPRLLKLVAYRTQGRDLEVIIFRWAKHERCVVTEQMERWIIIVPDCGEQTSTVPRLGAL